PREQANAKNRGWIAAYAKGRDYHDVLKKRLKTLATWIAAETGADVKVFVDTAPVMEKPLAAAAGLGWQGKHTNLVSRQYGSWLFLGAIFSTLDLHGLVEKNTKMWPLLPTVKAGRTCVEPQQSGASDGASRPRAVSSRAAIS
ncbi:MAG: DUF1730 domain-containing protein, partial [Gemmatimonadaceae bacterium]|nr:DUF1730 domain-containing protein [Gemmatimonadaceae bacterium]